jgi:hypothetical protein
LVVGDLTVGYSCSSPQAQRRSKPARATGARFARALPVVEHAVDLDDVGLDLTADRPARGGGSPPG